MSSTCSQVFPGILCVFLLSGLCTCLRHYILVNEPKTWTLAQSYCREKYTDLATVESMDDMDRLIAAASNSYGGRVWIGLYDIWWSWRWTLPEDYLFGNEEYIAKWAPNEPDNARNLWELCACFVNGYWHDTNCNQEWFFVCYNNTNTGLPMTSTERYILINEPKTMHEAHEYCLQHHTDLASVRTKTEDEVMQQVVPEGTVALVGMHRYTWMWWSDGSEHIFDHWLDGHPASNTGNCAASVVDAANFGKLVEHNCEIEFPFMCYDTNAKKVLRIKLTALKSTSDLNDPAVTEAILSQVKKKLKEGGITESLNISWIKQPDKKIFYKEGNGADV